MIPAIPKFEPSYILVDTRDDTILAFAPTAQRLRQMAMVLTDIPTDVKLNPNPGQFGRVVKTKTGAPMKADLGGGLKCSDLDG